MTLEQINKVAVRKAIQENGKWIGKIVPCKMHPTNPWGTAMDIETDNLTHFEDICDTFTMYNCNNQVGRYIHFYQETPNQPEEGSYVCDQCGDIIPKAVIHIHHSKEESQ